MRRVVHLSDLHFGRTRPELLDPLVEMVNAEAPDLIAISGDLTQRARHAEFRQARAFIDRLEARCIVVPGNHDVPLDNVGVRFLAPWRRYRRWIGDDLEPAYTDEELAVIGINTTDPFAWQRGRVRRRSIRHACVGFSAADRVGILVAHHPFEHLPGEPKTPMLGAVAAMDALAHCGVQIVLTGHLHAWRAAPFVQERHGGALQIQAGTGLSTRLRGEDNDFNLLTIEGNEVVVERFVAGAGDRAFVRTAAVPFRRVGGVWVRGGAGEAAAASG